MTTRCLTLNSLTTSSLAFKVNCSNASTVSLTLPLSPSSEEPSDTNWQKWHVAKQREPLRRESSYFSTFCICFGQNWCWFLYIFYLQDFSPKSAIPENIAKRINFDFRWFCFCILLPLKNNNWWPVAEPLKTGNLTNSHASCQNEALLNEYSQSPLIWSAGQMVVI